jgi:hypothetical protein
MTLSLSVIFFKPMSDSRELEKYPQQKSCITFEERKASRA